MKKKIVVLGIVFALSALCAVYFLSVKPKDNSECIAVFTTLSHPALTRASEGFKTKLTELAPDLKLIDYNAEGNVQQANLIAQQIAYDQNIVGVYAIGTLALQSIAKVEKKRPIVFAAVSDPRDVVGDKASLNISGLTDEIDAAFQMQSIMNMLPSLKSISLLYTPHEANAVSMVNKLNKEAQRRGIEVSLLGVHDAQQVMNSSLKACQKSDAVIIPLDNQLASTMPLVIKATKALKCPVIISDEALMHHGASIAFGVDYKKSGEEAALIMSAIKSGESTALKIGFINPKNPSVHINHPIIEEKGINIVAQNESEH